MPACFPTAYSLGGATVPTKLYYGALSRALAFGCGAWLAPHPIPGPHQSSDDGEGGPKDNPQPALLFGGHNTDCLLTTAPLSKHSARLHFKDSECRLQFVNGLSYFGMFANFVLQSLQQIMSLHELTLVKRLRQG